MLDPDFDCTLFSNQVVLVGGVSEVPYLGGKETDEWPTPWSLLGYRKTPGTEVNATACLNYLRREWLEALPEWAETILILGTGLLCGFGFAYELLFEPEQRL